MYAHRDGLLSFLGGTCFASIAFGYPQRIFGMNPKPPRLRKCYDFFNSGQFLLTGWESVCYPESAEIFCAAPLQLNTQHNRYFTLPVERTARSRQTGNPRQGRGYNDTPAAPRVRCGDGVRIVRSKILTRSVNGCIPTACLLCSYCLGASGK